MKKNEAAEIIRELLKHNLAVVDEDRILSDKELSALNKAVKELDKSWSRKLAVK